MFTFVFKLYNNHKSMQDGIRSRRWFGTSFVLESDQGRDEDWYKQYTKRLADTILQHGALWCVAQFERGEGGRAHLQFCIQFGEAKSRQSVRRLECWPSQPHLEPARGTPAQCYAYCSKECGRICEGFEAGRRPSPGSRKDLADIYYRLRSDGDELKRVADEYPGQYMRYGRAFRDAKSFFDPELCRRQAVLLWGPTGTGKSRNARWVVGDRRIYDKPDGKWWDGYDGEEITIWDDFDPEETTIKSLLRLIDWVPARIEIKGAFARCASEWFIFTNNKELFDWYGEKDDDFKEALERRFTFIIHLTDVATFKKGNEQDWVEAGFKQIKLNF